MINGGTEIPPLDDAADITRSSETQSGQTLADPRNWAGYMLLLFGALAAGVAIIAAAAGAIDVGAVSAVLAVVAIAAGMAMIAVLRRRRRGTFSGRP